MAIVTPHIHITEEEASSVSSQLVSGSLDFRGKSYLTRTPTTAGSTKIFTFSAWVKKGVDGQNGDTIFAAGSGSSAQTAVLLDSSTCLLYTSPSPRD